MSDKRPGRPSVLSPEQRDLVERFVSAYNAIDQELRRRIGAHTGDSFSWVVDKYAETHRQWKGQGKLRVFGDLRNLIVHGSTVRRIRARDVTVAVIHH